MTVFDSGETTALAQAFERAVEAHRAGQTAAAIAGYEVVQAIWPKTRGRAHALGVWRHG